MPDKSGRAIRGDLEEAAGRSSILPKRIRRVRACELAKEVEVVAGKRNKRVASTSPAGAPWNNDA